MQKNSFYKLLPINKDEYENDQLVIFSSMLLAVIVLISISAISIFLLYDDMLLNIGNLLVLPVIIYFFLSTKKSSDVPRASLLLLSFVFLALLYNIYEIGLGSNVIDIIWFTIVILAAILFVNTKSGLIFFALTLLTFIILMIDEKSTRYFYNTDSVKPDSNYNFITFIFYTCLLFATILSFINIIKKLQEKNKTLSEQKINELDVLVKARTTEIENLRRQIAMDFHDEMGNKLASIVSLTDIISFKLKTNTESVEEPLNNIRKKSQELYDGTRDFLWTINAFDNSVIGLYEHIKYFAQELFSEVGIEFDATNHCSSNLPLRSNEMFNLIMIAKESFSNVVKHAQANKVTLALNEAEDSFVFEIKDNGIGFNTDIAAAGMGLKNMQERSMKIKTEIHFSSSYGKGSTITISIPKLNK